MGFGRVEDNPTVWKCGKKLSSARCAINNMAFFAQQENIRVSLRRRGFRFCDDGFELERREKGNAVDLGQEVQLRAINASTCDHPAQVKRPAIRKPKE